MPYSPIDINGLDDPWTISDRAYDNEFLSALSTEFKFDAHTAEYADEIRRIGRNYVIFRRAEHPDIHTAKSEKAYRAFLKVTEKFCRSLQESYENPDFYNIATEMLISAQGRGEPEPQKEFPGLSDHQRRVEAHYRELVRLTELLKTTLTQGIARSKRKRGPKPDLALEYLVKLSAVFWTLSLEREFTLDYHAGTGHTLAFAFVRALLRPFADVNDTQIVTAMRAEIAELRKHTRRSDRSHKATKSVKSRIGRAHRN